jgi:hypothetical protein
MENNTEKVVVIFDRVDKTAITVIESLGGEIQKQKAVKDEQHPLIGKWVKCVCIDADKGGHFTNGKWYQCMSDVEKRRAFINDKGQKDGFHPHNDEFFNLTDARDYNPDEVKALVGKLVKHKQSGEYHLFVECNHPLCEVEGVTVNRELLWKREKIGDQYVLYTEYDLKDFKEKEVELLVPDNVKFYDWAGDIALEVSEGVFLSIGDSKKGFVITSSDAQTKTPIKCKLVPVKYEDVQVGDFVIIDSGDKNKVSNYSMKHGDKKFCGMLYDGSFTFNKDWYNGRIDLLKVVRC